MTSPTSPAAVVDYSGTWSGDAWLRQCTLGGVAQSDCTFLPRATSLGITLTHELGRNVVQGTINAGSNRFTVTGRLEADGSLSLSGVGIGTTATLRQWRSRDTNGVMTGTFTYDTSAVGQPASVTAELDGVVKPGVARPPVPVPAVRFFLEARQSSALRYGSRADFPGYTLYTACFFIENYAPIRALLTFTITPIGPDGRDVPVQQEVIQGQQPSVSARNVSSGCGGGFARDYNLSNPIAARYRLRVDYAYDDGFTGFAESIGTVVVVRDETR